MPVLKKLQIRGIRSFDPKEENTQVIEFFTPLTLIFGHNGCGKTTVIEAIKYALTNSFPAGTDNGKYFINNPYVRSDYEVLGQVALELTSSNGSSVHVSRGMKSTQKAGAKKATFSSIEGTMWVIRNGRKVDMSSKCPDMKVEMCRFMGVSDAILNFVIFCRQEETCWPLDEGEEVKERFDEIFNTTGYIQTLKQLDLKEKDTVSKMKISQTKLKSAQEKSEIVLKKQKVLTALGNQLAMLADSDAKCAEEQQELLQMIREVEEIEQDDAKHTADVSVCKEKVRSSEEQVEVLRQNIKEEFRGDFGELKKVLQDFQWSAKEKWKEIEKLTSAVTQLDHDLSNLRSKQQMLLMQEGKSEESNDLCRKSLQNLGLEFLEKIRKLKPGGAIEDVSVSLSPTIDTILTCESDENSLDQIFKAIHAAMLEKETEFSKVKSDLDAQERELQGQMLEVSIFKKQIEEYENSKVKLAEVKKLMRENKGQVDKVEGQAGRLRQELVELMELNKADEIKDRDLQDNLNLLEKLEELTKLRADLSCKEKLLREVKKRGSAGNQKWELSRQCERVAGKLNESKRKSCELNKDIQSIQEELGGDYRNAHADFVRQFVIATSDKRAHLDIRKLKKDEDDAITALHSKRIENINSSLKTYWKQAYKGNEIDYIQIRTEDEEAAGRADTQKTWMNKSLKYRVVMLKGGVEFDMRSRCSAGEKVLASIIIRVSLADAFSSECGIIALDEPTTNLDATNTSALADMLNAFLMHMSITKTFQLILNTHDEQFMAKLLEIGEIETYYKVGRNNTGYSEIVQVRN